jgi:hypothetical protein
MSDKLSLPFEVKNWLVQQYLTDPMPPQMNGESVVLVRFEAFTAQLLKMGIPLLPSLDRWKEAGWIIDFAVEIQTTDQPRGIPSFVARLRLPPGRHRLVGICKSVLNADVQASDAEPTDPEDIEVAMRQAVAAAGGEVAARIFRIAEDAEMSADQKCRAIHDLDPTKLAWSSVEWSQLLRVTPEAIRQTDWWRIDRKRLLAGDSD